MGKRRLFKTEWVSTGRGGPTPLWLVVVINVALASLVIYLLASELRLETDGVEVDAAVVGPCVRGRSGGVPVAYTVQGRRQVAQVPCGLARGSTVRIRYVAGDPALVEAAGTRHYVIPAFLLVFLVLIDALELHARRARSGTLDLSLLGKKKRSR